MCDDPFVPAFAALKPGYGLADGVLAMHWFQKFGFFDYIEFIGMFLAFSDFMRLSERLEKIIGVSREKLDTILVRNFHRANPDLGRYSGWRIPNRTSSQA